LKAIVYNKYGPPDVLELTEVEKPIPKDNQVLVKIHAASVNYGNLVLLKGEPFLARLAFGLLKPKYSIPGGDIAGRVEAVGKEVKQFQPGDEVFGDLSGCGWGAFAEYVSVPEHVLALKPANISFEEAAAVPMAGVTALQGLRDKGKIQAGQKVLVNGAGGGVGSFAVQLAKALGAEVTGVDNTGKPLFTGPSDPSTRLPSQNSSGWIARFSDINPGADGQFRLVVSWAGSPGPWASRMWPAAPSFVRATTPTNSPAHLDPALLPISSRNPRMACGGIRLSRLFFDLKGT
jgi:hypothetical protein